MNRITTLPGDGIGPEVTTEAIRVLQTIAAIHEFRFEFEEHAIGGVAIKNFGSPLPRTTLDAALASDAVLLGAVGSPEFDRVPPNQTAGSRSVVAAKRAWRVCEPAAGNRILVNRGLFTRARGSRARHDILIVRELLGGLYFGEPRGIDRRRRATRCVTQSRRSSASRESRSKLRASVAAK
jgi:3-isopropylmalate dehydrogenase